MTLYAYSPASEEKFRSLYKIADSVQLEDAVFKLVTLAQVALYLFKLLDKRYIDGLLCNQTNQAFWIFYQKYDPVKTTEVNFYWLKKNCMCLFTLIVVYFKRTLDGTSFISSYYIQITYV